MLLVMQIIIQIQKYLNYIGDFMNYSEFIKGVIANKLKEKYNNDYSSSKRNTKIQVACILDEFSYECFKYEGVFHQITPLNWKYFIDTFHPEFLFVESAWEGANNSWRYKVANYSKDKEQTLKKITEYCKSKGIPTVFWGKEDPYDFEIFIDAAALFDFIFTTDIGSIQNYKDRLNHEKVFLLPFGAQPAIHNPIDKGRIKKGQIIFPGGWYSKFPDRCDKMEKLLDGAMNYDLKIYDRFSNSKDKRNGFPNKYKNFIEDCLEYQKLLKEIKKFDVLLNANSVDDSPTNFSRRVFESLASGIPVFSSFSLGIQEYFKDIVSMADSREEIKEGLGKLLSSKYELDKKSLLGLREVLNNHTYSHRMRTILDTLDIENNLLVKEGVSIITATNRPQSLDNILNNYLGQCYEKKELIIIINNNKVNLVEWKKMIGFHDDIKIFKLDEKYTLGECLNYAVRNSKYNYISKFDDDDYYGPNYLIDVINAFTFTDASIVGKYSVFAYMEDSKELLLRFPGNEYRYMDYVAGSTLTFKKEIFDYIQFTHRNKSEDTLFINDCINQGYKIYSSDRFNHIITRRNDLSTHTWKISNVEFRKNCILISKNMDFNDIVFI